MLQYLVQVLFPMQHLRWNFCEKNDNSWELLLTVFTELHLKCKGLLDPTLKGIDKFRLRQQSIPSSIYIFSASKKTQNDVSNIFKANNKDTITMSGASIVEGHLRH